LLWDIQGHIEEDDVSTSADFGAHPGTQSLFFSSQSLYLLAWDLAERNPKAYRREAKSNAKPRARDKDDHSDDSDDDDDSDEENEDEYLREEANRQADRALSADISNRVLLWVNCIARRDVIHS
jgi:hypothetical protein